MKKIEILLGETWNEVKVKQMKLYKYSWHVRYYVTACIKDEVNQTEKISKHFISPFLISLGLVLTREKRAGCFIAPNQMKREQYYCGTYSHRQKVNAE